MIGTIIARNQTISAFEALNRRDLSAHLRDYSDDATYEFPSGVFSSGTFQGKRAIEGWFARFFEQFPALRFTLRQVLVENIFALGGTNTVAVAWDFTYTNRKGTQDTNSGVTVVSIRGGKVRHVRLYIFDPEAQQRAWEE